MRKYGMYWICTDEEKSKKILEQFCSNKSKAWRVFFGLRTVDKNNVSKYLIPNRAEWKLLFHTLYKDDKEWIKFVNEE